MVILCQKCQTRFQLDESRIPAKGARVRCSRCKHAFLVVPPGAHDETVHRIAADAAAGARPAVPEPTLDLPGPARRPGRPAGGDESEDDWQFNIEPPADSKAEPSAPPAAVRPTPSAPEAPSADAQEEDSLDSLFELGGLRDPDPAVLEGEITDSDPTPFDHGGADLEAPETAPASAQADARPDRWDFSQGDDGPAVPAAAPPVRAAGQPRRRGAVAASASSEAREPAETSPAPSPRRDRSVGLRGAEPALAGRLLGAAAWLPAFALFAFGLLGSLQPAPAPRELPAERVGTLELHGLRARHLENYWSGPLLVVQGELQNPGQGAASLGGAPQLRLTGTSGPALAPAWLGAALHEGALRERDPRELAAALEHSARQLAARPLRPGESLPVQAVFEAPPEAAGGLRVELASVTLPAVAPAAPASEPAEPEEGAAP